MNSCYRKLKETALQRLNNKRCYSIDVLFAMKYVHVLLRTRGNPFSPARSSERRPLPGRNGRVRFHPICEHRIFSTPIGSRV
jgi:hypothetical protein